MGVVVAVLDTGIYRHRDFGNRIIAFADFVNAKMYPYDDSGHGTHVSGIIAGNGAASSGKYRGVAPKSNIVGVKVLDQNGNGRISDVIKGLAWILENKEKYNIRIVNISFGTTQSDGAKDGTELVEMVEKLWDAGIVVVAAAGNSGPKESSVTAPGVSRKIITVGAFDDLSSQGKLKNINGIKWLRSETGMRYYSGRGPTESCIVKPELVVSGSNMVACTNKKDSYSVKSGTSMAAPIVSGAIARLIEKKREITPREVKIRLKGYCHKLNLDANQQGWGMLDIAGFVTGKEIK